MSELDASSPIVSRYYKRNESGACRNGTFVCGCFKSLVFRVSGAREEIYVCSQHRNRDLDDRIHDCLGTSMVAVQAEDVNEFFLFVGGLTG